MKKNPINIPHGHYYVFALIITKQINLSTKSTYADIMKERKVTELLCNANALSGGDAAQYFLRGVPVLLFRIHYDW